MRTCENCKYSEPMVGALACMGQKGMPYVRPTDSCDRWKTMKQTNYDRIISKTPEELAVMISESIDCGACEEMHGFRMCDAAPDKVCEDCWAGWLQQEAE